MQRTCVYVDGFNLYYGCLKGTPYRWLDLAHLCQLLLTNNDVIKIKYFTALVNARPDDPSQPVRQQLYLRALKTLPNVEIFLGHYLSHVVSLPLAQPPAKGSKWAKVIKTEEKGSDVNLAAQLLADGFRGKYDCAVVISNDSDLLMPIQIAKNELGKAVGILNPHEFPARVLYNAATFKKPIRQAVLQMSQFPTTLTDSSGTFHKPTSW
jgi:hypothetical protein